MGLPTRTTTAYQAPVARVILDRSVWLHSVLFTLALLAIVMRVAVPPGFMADPTGRAGLVICTGHGPLTDHKGSDPAKTTPDIPCAFAGHAAVDAPDVIIPRISVAWVAVSPPQLRKPDLAPGRGLAAPPPPAVGPPVSLI